MEKILEKYTQLTWVSSLLVGIGFILFMEYFFSVVFLYSLIEVINYFFKLKLALPSFFSYINLSVFTLFISLQGIFKTDLNIQRITKKD